MLRAAARSQARRGFGTRVEIILKEEVPKLGKANEIVSVKAGYMRNYLYPKRLAVYGTKDLMEKHRATMAVVESAETTKAEELAHLQSMIEGIALKFNRDSNDGATLYGSVSASDIVDAMEHQHDIKLLETMLTLPGDERALKTLGEHVVLVQLSEDTGTVDLRVDVQPENQ